MKILFLSILLFFNYILTVECPLGDVGIACWQHTQCQPPIAPIGSQCIKGYCRDIYDNPVCVENPASWQ